jgi:hypothetical protein
MPAVSVVIPAFNHEKYVAACLQSVLDQSWQDFEVVVTDDGSTDHTVDVIRDLRDPRIRLLRHERNRGASAALNNSIRNARGRLIAVHNSDDMWDRSRLEKQVDFLQDHPAIGAVFARPRFVDEAGLAMSPSEYKHHYVFDVRNRSRFEWLNYFFFHGNCLCHPSLLVRRECLEKVGLYDERLANLPDLDLWIRLCQEYEIYILEERLVLFRIREEDANKSSNRIETQLRAHFELKQILDHYLSLDEAAFRKVFPGAPGSIGLAKGPIPFLLGHMALDLPHSEGQLWGMEQIFKCLETDKAAKELEEKLDFRGTDLHVLTGKNDPFNLLPAQQQYPRLGSARYQKGPFLRAAVRLHWWLAGLLHRIFSA